jgi:hypothetical protein
MEEERNKKRWVGGWKGICLADAEGEETRRNERNKIKKGKREEETRSAGMKVQRDIRQECV